MDTVFFTWFWQILAIKLKINNVPITYKLSKRSFWPRFMLFLKTFDIGRLNSFSDYIVLDLWSWAIILFEKRVHFKLPLSPLLFLGTMVINYVSLNNVGETTNQINRDNLVVINANRNLISISIYIINWITIQFYWICLQGVLKREISIRDNVTSIVRVLLAIWNLTDSVSIAWVRVFRWRI